jgi:hypothetical protein
MPRSHESEEVLSGRPSSGGGSIRKVGGQSTEPVRGRHTAKVHIDDARARGAP